MPKPIVTEKIFKKMKSLYAKLKSISEVSRRMGLSTTCVNYHLKKTGFLVRKKFPYSQEEDKLIKEYFSSGKRVHDQEYFPFCKSIHRSPIAIYQRAFNLKLHKLGRK